MCWVLLRTINALRSLDEIFFARFVNVGNVLLRISIHEGKPGALDLNHDPVTALNVWRTSCSGRSTWVTSLGYERLRLLVAVPKATSNDLAPNHHLVSAHFVLARTRGAGSASRRERHRSVSRSSRRRTRTWRPIGRPGWGRRASVVFEDVGLVDQDVGSAARRSLVVGHVRPGSCRSRYPGKGHRLAGSLTYSS